MTSTTRTIGSLIIGFFGGLAIAFIICVITGVLAIATNSTASLPGIFSAQAGQDDGMLALTFEPNFVGILLVAAVCAVLSGVASARTAKALSSSK